MNSLNKLEEFKGSNAWDNKFALPLIPMHNNPWIYSAYVRKLCGGFDSEMDYILFSHMNKCEVEPGLFNRWPDGSGGVTSHDEIMGLAYHDHDTAKDILLYLEKHDGEYINVHNPGKWTSEKFNVYRFIFLKPYLKACAEWHVSLLSQAQFSAFLIYDLITHKGIDPAGRLRIWIMLEAMEIFPLSGFVISIWRKIMKNKNITPKLCFTHYLAEVPIMKKMAPEYF